VDAVTFRRFAHEGGRTELETAAKLYRGEFLEGLEIRNDEYESWRREESTRFRDQMIDVLARLDGTYGLKRGRRKPPSKQARTCMRLTAA
jgi:hypothetical protein